MRKKKQKIVISNNKFVELTGFHPAYFIGKNCRFLQGPETDQEIVQALRLSIRRAIPIQVQILNYRKNGTPFLNALMMFPLFCSSRSPEKLTHFFALQKDISMETLVIRSMAHEPDLHHLLSSSTKDPDSFQSEGDDLPRMTLIRDSDQEYVEGLVRSSQTVVRFTSALEGFINDRHLPFYDPSELDHPRLINLRNVPSGPSQSSDSVPLVVSPPWSLTIISPIFILELFPSLYDQFVEIPRCSILSFPEFSFEAALKSNSVLVIPCTACPLELSTEGVWLSTLEDCLQPLSIFSALKTELTRKFRGEMCLGNTIVIQLSSTCLGIFVCAGLSCFVYEESVYQATRAALSTFCQLLESPREIEMIEGGVSLVTLKERDRRVYLPSFLGLFSRAESISPFANQIALQKKLAFQKTVCDFYAPVGFDHSGFSAQSLSDQFRLALDRQSNSNISKDFSRIVALCRRGQLAKRGLANTEEVFALISLLQPSVLSPPDIFLLIVEISRLLSHPKSILHPSISVCLRNALLQSSQALSYFLNEPEIQSFRTIKLNDISNHSKKLGSGASATVFAGTWEGRPCAVKIFNLGQETSCLLRELNFASLLCHTNVVQIYGGFVSGPTSEEIPSPDICVMELMEGGNLRQVLDSQNSSEVPARALTWLFHIAQAIEYLHLHSLLHRDIKSLNIVLSRSFEVAKLTDYGLSRANDRTMTIQVGSSPWMAPEIVNEEDYSFPVDIWAFGMVCYELLTAKIPYYHCRTGMGVLTEISSAKLPSLSCEFYHLFPVRSRRPIEKIYLHCTQAKPSKRPTASQLVQMIIETGKPPVGKSQKR